MGIEEINNQEIDDDVQKDMYMSFKSGEEYFAIKITCVNQIIGFRQLSEVPEEEGYIKGIINYRGNIIPVIDISLRFKQNPIEYTERTCIIIIEAKSVTVGLIVEQIADVITIPKENIEPPPSIGKKGDIAKKYICGVGMVNNEIKFMLDPDKLIDDKDIDVFEELRDEK